MRKTKKALASLAIAGMVLSMAPMSVFAATDSNRISDLDRVGTAIAVANNGWTSSDNVIVVPADDANIVDALAAAPLAGQLNAPILVTYKGALDPKVQQKIVDLGAKNVYAVGALSDSVVSSLKAISGVTVSQLKGADRTETAAMVAAKLTNVKGSFVVSYNGTPDAMSAASFAAANGYDILVANPDGTLPSNEAAYKTGTVYTVGGQVKLDGATALAGADRYATNDAVINGLTYNYDKVYVANGESLVDALAGASLAAQTKSPIVLADATHAATAVNAKATAATKVIALGGTGAVSDSVLGQVGYKVSGPVSVQSVKVASATNIQVTFNAAPTDTSKVTFTVQRNTTPVTVTASWNGAVATLTSDQNLPEGTYSVAVKNDTTDLGTSTVDVTAQKIAKISITSSKLGVQNVTTGNGIGYATYAVFDQYGNDITSQSLANNLTFQTGVGSATGRNGIIKVTPSMNLLQFSTVVLTGYDSTSGVSTSATLAVSTQVGTLSDIKLGELTNADGKKLTAGDTASLFYVSYTATDMSGNQTQDYDMVHDGLILNNSDQITTSSPYVTATVVHDPSDSTKAAIQVQVTGSNSDVTMDLPLVMTAMTYTGSTSALNTTLYKASAVDTFTLMAPAYDIAVGDSKSIPFVAYDQNGKQLTKASDLGTVNFSTNVTPGVNVDGTLKLTFAPTTKGTQVITATTATGKYSSLTINVQEKAVADTLTVDSSVLVPIMQGDVIGGTTDKPIYATKIGDALNAAAQNLDFGWDNGGLTLKDQYGRVIDMTTVDSTKAGYSVTVSSSDPSVVDAAGTAQVGQNEMTLTALQPGTATLTLKLFSSATVKADGTTPRDPSVAVDTKTVTVSVVKNSDIKDYTVSTLANPVYTANTTSSAVAVTNDYDYKFNPKVYGTTSSGAKVLLAGTPIVGASLSNTTDFTLFKGGPSASGSTITTTMTYPTSYSGVKVIANKYADSTKTSASATLAITILGADGAIHPVNTTVSSTNASPVAASVDKYVDTSVTGISVSGDVVKLDGSVTGSYAALLNGTLAKYSAAGVTSNVYIAPTDQYGTTAQPLTFYVTGTSGTFSMNSDGTINTYGTKGDKVKISGVTKNGLVKTIEIDFN